MNYTWSRAAHAPAGDPLDVALAEIDVAITLVQAGQARRVHLVGLAAAERAAGQGLARAQAAGVHFALERTEPPARAASIVIGPAIDD